MYSNNYRHTLVQCICNFIMNNGFVRGQIYAHTPKCLHKDCNLLWDEKIKHKNRIDSEPITNTEFISKQTSLIHYFFEKNFMHTMDQDDLIQFMAIPNPTNYLMHPIVLQIIHIFLLIDPTNKDTLFCATQFDAFLLTLVPNRGKYQKKSCSFPSIINTNVVFANLFATLKLFSLFSIRNQNLVQLVILFHIIC